MNEQKMWFYHVQALRLNYNRRWQSMAIWPLVYLYGGHLKMLFEYSVFNGRFRIDLFIPAINFAIEIDEPHHDNQLEIDAFRQHEIEQELNCRFFRIKVNNPVNFYDQLTELSNIIQQKIDQDNIPEWEIPPMENPVVELLQALEEAGIPELIQNMIRELDAVGMNIINDYGPVIPQNGELGFTIQMNEIRFVVSVRRNKSAKLLVTDYNDNALEKLEITLDGPKYGRVNYYNINEFQGRYEIQELIDKLILYYDILNVQRTQSDCATVKFGII